MKYNDSVIHKFIIRGSNAGFVQIDPKQDKHSVLIVDAIVFSLFVSGGIWNNRRVFVHLFPCHLIDIELVAALHVLAEVSISAARHHGIKYSADAVQHRAGMQHRIEIMCFSGYSMVDTVYHHEIFIALQFKLR